MSCPVNTKFKNIKHYGDPTLITEIETNLKHWFDWAFVNIGGWTNVEGETTGPYGGRLDQLEEQAPGVYKAIRKDWVYEDIDYLSENIPIQSIFYDVEMRKTIVNLTNDESNYFWEDAEILITDNTAVTGEQRVSGILSSNKLSIYGGGDGLALLDLVGGGSLETLTSGDLELYMSLTETGLGGYINIIHRPLTPRIYNSAGDDFYEYNYNIDYPNGRVVFYAEEDAEYANGVFADYSFRAVQTYVGGHNDWNFEVQKNSFNPADLSWENGATSGDFGIDPAKAIQLPAIIIECVPKKTATGAMLGSSALRIKQDVLLKVVAQTKAEKDFITDILCEQEGKSLNLYDIDLVNKSYANALTHEGFKNQHGISYEEMVTDPSFFFAKAYIENATMASTKTNNPDLHISEVIYTIEVIK